MLYTSNLMWLDEIRNMCKLYFRLTEIGPRMTMRLVKIEEGVGEGEVLYHQFIKKTPEELQASKALKEKKRWVK